MKKIINMLLAGLLATNFAACWDGDDIDDLKADSRRHQVVGLQATPGDEEVALSWNMPEGWSPSDFIIRYNDAEANPVVLHTNGAMHHTVTDLVNGTDYVFQVQAIYGSLISNPVEVGGKPTTSRIAVSTLAAEAGDTFVLLTWTKPATTLTSYTLSYFKEDTPEQVETVQIDKDADTYTAENLTNDLNYTFSLVANYAKGPSEPATVKAMPTQAVPFFLDRELAAANQPITFTFNREAYTSATDVQWTFPDGTVREGDVVKQGISSTGEQNVTLSARIGTTTRKWTITVTIREYVIFHTDWAQDGTNYNGFKGACPVFSPDGKTVYNVTFNKVAALYAFDVVSGAEKWRYVPQNNSGSYNMCTVNPVTGDIYYGTTTSGQFYAVTPEGALKWQFKEAGSMQSAAPAVNAAGTEVYICDAAGNVFAIDAASGAKLWSFAAGGKGGGLLVNGNELLVGSASTSFYFLSTENGSELAKVTLPKGVSDISGLAVSNDKKTVYVPLLGGGLSAIDLATRTLKTTLQVAANNLYEPVVAPNGTIFVGSKDSKVYCIDANLTSVLWSHAHLDGTNNAYNYSHPCVDSENRFYISSGQVINSNYIFSADGAVIDKWTFGSSNAQKQMGGNNFNEGVFYAAFIGAANDNGIFAGRYVGGERAATWSGHGGDICGSCCIR